MADESRYEKMDEMEQATEVNSSGFEGQVESIVSEEKSERTVIEQALEKVQWLKSQSANQLLNDPAVLTQTLGDIEKLLQE